MSRYFSVLFTFYKAAVLTDLEYRANFLVNMVLSLVNIGWQIGGIGIFFLHTEKIGDWTFSEVLLVVGLYIVFLGFIEMILYPNVQEIVRHIRLGTMDFILTKPIDSQFHASLRKISIWKGVDVLIGVGIVFYALALQPSPPSAGNVLLFGLLCICAVVILYSLMMLLITSAFWFVQLENVMELLLIFFDAARFPVTIFPAWLRILLTFVVPIAFVTTFPAAVLLNRLDSGFVLLSIAIAILMLSVSIAFWRFALRHYASASS